MTIPADVLKLHDTAPNSSNALRAEDLLEEWEKADGPPTWDVRGKYGPEVRALAEDAYRARHYLPPLGQ